MALQAFLRSFALAVFIAVLVPPAVHAQDQRRIDFISVIREADDDDDINDRRLRDYLQKSTHISFNPASEKEYSRAINAVAAREEGRPYVARLTPYAFVAAEILGARFEPLATYVRKNTRDVVTYRSYFVVRKADFPGDAPTLEAIAAYVKAGNRRFVYHDEFSTSSYFIPSLWLRQQEVYHYQPGSAKSDRRRRIHPLSVVPLEPGSSSSDIIRAVLGKLEVKTAQGTTQTVHADIGAVWDGTVAGNAEAGKDVWFVPLDPPLPNDFLVCSVDLGRERKQKLRAAIEAMNRDRSISFQGDVSHWVDIDAAADARRALGALRRLALPQPTPVTIDITVPEGQIEQYRPLVEAAKHAIRFAGTEFVPYDPDFHGSPPDVTWHLTLPHEGSLKLVSTINIDPPSPLVPPQELDISFNDEKQDLPKRIEERIHSRMNRIRYVWPFRKNEVTVLRDINLSLQNVPEVIVQEITWLDPKTHFYTPGNYHTFHVKETDLRKFTLENVRGVSLSLNPLSNVAYRVVLVRPKSELPLFRALTVALLILFAAAAVFAGYEFLQMRRDAARRDTRAANPQPSAGTASAT